MSTEKSNLVGPNGQPVETRTIPIVKYNEFIFPMHMVEKEEIVQLSDKGIKPSDIIKELRATAREMRHRFTVIAAGLVVAAQKGPEELDKFLSSIGLVITDAKGQKFFEYTPEDPDRFVEEPVEMNTPAEPTGEES